MKKFLLFILCCFIVMGTSACGTAPINAETSDETNEKVAKSINPDAEITYYDDIVSDDWHYTTKFSETGFSFKDLIHIKGSLYYDRYTRIVYIYVSSMGGGINITPYYGPHGHKCKYLAEETKIIELEGE